MCGWVIVLIVDGAGAIEHIRNYESDKNSIFSDS
jgi:hypothetical protein